MMEYQSSINSLTLELMRQKNEHLIKSISDLVTKGILVIRESQLEIVNNVHDSSYKLAMTYEILPKEHEYIKMLEDKCKILEQTLAKIKKEVL